MTRLLAIASSTLLFAPATSQTAWAGTQSPHWPDCAEDRRDACPNDLDDWEHFSWVPDGSKDSVRVEELEMGSGIGLDRALQRTSGLPGIIVAVLDTGIEWGEGQLWSQIALNEAELPPPSSGADPDGDGRLTVYDYADDDRVDPTAGSGPTDWLDPSDLLVAFSDGVDDDGNGFVDDIAGWDFFADDNDPFAVVGGPHAGHGTGVAKLAVAPANDGGSIGVCPGCTLLPLRVGDSFVVAGERVGPAIAYAAERGTSVAAMAIGAMTSPTLADRAFGYAESEGMVVVGAIGDEYSWHRNEPAAIDNILNVHSIRGDNRNEDAGTFSYFNTSNCNNFGPRLDLVAPSDLCATGAVGAIAGAAGLVFSAGIEAGQPLSPADVRALLRSTATDVALSLEDRQEAKAPPSRPGWDAFFGYGRVDVGTAVHAVFDGALPPTVTLTSPRWFSRVDRQDEAMVEVVGSVERAASWTLELSPGAGHLASSVVASGEGPIAGVLATLETGSFRLANAAADLADETVEQRFERAHEPMQTLVLRATGEDGSITEERVSLFVEHDPAQLDGWPLDLGGSVEGAAILVDLDGDGVLEVVLSTSSGLVHALRGDGSSMAGFPVAAQEHGLADHWPSPPPWSDGEPLHEGFFAGPAAGDLDGDGVPELVATSNSGSLYAWHADGTTVAGFPVAIDGRPPEAFVEGAAWENGFFASPALGDLDGDGDLEVVAAAMDQRLYVWDGDGTLWPGYPLLLCNEEPCDVLGARVVATPALGDIDGDGDLDAAVGSNELPVVAGGWVYLVDLAAAELWGAPLHRPGLINQSILPMIGEGHPAPVSLGDIDGDGDLELFSNAMLGASGPYHHDGTEAVDVLYTADGAGPGTNFSGGSFLPMVAGASIGDLDGDGTPDLVIGGAGVDWLVALATVDHLEYQHAVGAWSGVDGTSMVGFPRQIDDVAFMMTAALADVSGDGLPEVITGSGGGFLYAWDHTGALASRWPHFTGGWSLAGPAVGDIDGDGWLDVVLTTRDGLVFAWGTEGRADAVIPWPMARHDPANTSNHEVALPLQAGPVEPTEPLVTRNDEAGCCGSGRASFPLALLLLLALPGRRRR
jgi:hypothetical protein